MLRNDKVLKIDLVMALSKSLDLISTVLTGHHLRVAYLALNVGLKLGLDKKRLEDLIVASLLHDAGALSLEERIDALDFDMQDLNYHANVGYCLLNRNQSFKRVAEIIRYHHLDWKDKHKYEESGIEIPIESFIVNVVDRIDVLTNYRKDLRSQVNFIIERINKEKGIKFNPLIIDVFKDVIKEYLDLPKLDEEALLVIFEGFLKDQYLDIDEVVDVTGIFENIIDFRSRFTSTHSSGVAATASVLGDIMGLSERHGKLLRIAGQLHDLGKLGVPGFILEKPGKLTDEEMEIMRKHALYTYQVLTKVRGFEVIPEWAAFHHEKLNGSGYPFRKTEEELSLESRIMAVADIFTAITEDRPYRKGMDKDRVLKVLVSMTKDNEIDRDVVSILLENYGKIDNARREAQTNAVKEFEHFRYNTYNLIAL